MASQRSGMTATTDGCGIPPVTQYDDRLRAASQAQISQVGATLRAFTVDGQDVDRRLPERRALHGRSRTGARAVAEPTHRRLVQLRRARSARRRSTSRADTTRSTGWCAGSTGRWSRHESDRVTLSCAVRPQPAYEWQLDLEITYAVDAAGLTVSFTAVNVDDEPAPFGVGFHPYLTLGTATVDALELTVPAAAFLDPDVPAETPRRCCRSPARRKDFTSARRIGRDGAGHRVRRPGARARTGAPSPGWQAPGQRSIRRAVGG